MQLFNLNVKENRRAAKCGVLVEKQEDFSIQSYCSQPEKTLSRGGWCCTNMAAKTTGDQSVL